MHVPLRARVAFRSRLALLLTALAVALLLGVAACSEPVDVSSNSVLERGDNIATAGIATTERAVSA